MASCTNPLSAEMKEYLKKMGSLIRKERLQQNLSGAELAKRSGVGVSTVWNIEKGEPSVSLKNVLSVLTALDCTDQVLKSIPADSSNPPGRQRAGKIKPRRVIVTVKKR